MQKKDILNAHSMEESLKVELGNLPAFAHQAINKDTALETIKSFFIQLVPTEQNVLRCLFRARNALTVKQLQREYLVIIRPCDWREAKCLSDKEFVAFISHFNKEDHGKKILAYITLKNILNRFEKIGVVNKRELAEQRAGEVWFLNPVLAKAYFYVINQIEKSAKNGSVSYIEEEAYFLLYGQSLTERDKENRECKEDEATNI